MRQQLRTHIGHACTVIKVPGDSARAAAYVGIDTRIAVNQAVKATGKTVSAVEVGVYAVIVTRSAGVYVNIRRALEAARIANAGDE